MLKLPKLWFDIDSEDIEDSHTRQTIGDTNLET